MRGRTPRRELAFRGWTDTNLLASSSERQAPHPQARAATQDRRRWGSIVALH